MSEADQFRKVLMSIITDCKTKPDKLACLRDMLMAFTSLDCQDLTRIVQLVSLGLPQEDKEKIHDVLMSLDIIDIQKFLNQYLQPVINDFEKINCIIDVINKVTAPKKPIPLLQLSSMTVGPTPPCPTKTPCPLPPICKKCEDCPKQNHTLTYVLIGIIILLLLAMAIYLFAKH